MNVRFRFLAVFVNSAYIGVMRSDVAETLVPTLCNKPGDVASLTYTDYMHEPTATKTTFYHNEKELLRVDHATMPDDYDDDRMWDILLADIDRVDEPSCVRLRTHKYNDRLGVFKYDRAYFRHSGKGSTHIKRDINRAARRVSVALIKEQLAA